MKKDEGRPHGWRLERGAEVDILTYRTKADKMPGGARGNLALKARLKHPSGPTMWPEGLSEQQNNSTELGAQLPPLEGDETKQDLLQNIGGCECLWGMTQYFFHWKSQMQKKKKQKNKLQNAGPGV